MRKIVSAFLTFVIAVLPLTCALPAATANADSAMDELLEAYYKCGDNLKWSLDTETGVFEVTGMGATYQYGFAEQPWYDMRELVKKIIIGEGVTVIAGGFLSGFTKAQSLELPSTLERVGRGTANYGIKEIIIPEKNNLTYFEIETVKSMAVYSGSVDKPVEKGTPIYVGNVLCTIKTPVALDSSVEIKEGTKYIMPEAFYNLSGVSDVSFPDTLICIGKDAFKGTTWYNNLPDGINYAGNVLLVCKNHVLSDGTNITLKDGTTGIAAGAFNGNTKLTGITLPASVEAVGDRAFFDCRNLAYVDFSGESKLHHAEDYAFANCYALKRFDVPSGLSVIPQRMFYSSALESFEIKDSIKEIKNGALMNSNIKSVYIPAHVKIGTGVFSSCSEIEKFTVAADHPDLMSDEYGAVYSKDKKILYYVPSRIEPSEYRLAETTEHLAASAFTGTEVKKIYFNDGLKSVEETTLVGAGVEYLDIGSGLETLPDDFIRNCHSLNFLEVPENIKSVGTSSIANNVQEIVFRSKDIDLGSRGVFVIFPDQMIFYCYKNSNAHIYAIEKGCSYVYLSDDNVGDYSKVEYAINKAKSINMDKYDKSWVSAIDESVRTVVYGIDASYQSTIDGFADELNDIFEWMNVSWSDYSAVDEAIERANALDRSRYSAKSLEELDATIEYVNSKRYCDVADSTLVNMYAYNINEAVDNLKPILADYSSLNLIVDQANAINRELYTQSSLAELDELIASIDWKSDNQELVSSFEEAVREAIENLEYLPADYSALDELKEKCSSLDRSLYTAESLQRLDDALKAAEEKLTVDKQAQADALIEAARNAYDLLEYLPADYSAVEQAKERVSALDRRYYSEKSLIILDNAVKTVVYGLDITEQARVDGFAQTINAAIDSLEYASIVLRHEPCGVIVSATTKEIKPDTVLAVEEVDSSEHEGTNFAVGGSIRSLHFYDINLVYETVTVQPDGTVTVKIKLADGVDPGKCKVYHVTDDIVNPLVRFASTIDGNYIAFETDHFSEFAVIEVEPVLTGIEISSLPAKTAYGIGEGLDISGMEIVAYFSDGSSRTVEDYDVGSVNTESIGTKKVMVYYTFGGVTKTAELEITVAAENASVEITRNGKSAESVTKKLGLFSLYSKASIQLGCNTKNSTGLSVQWSSDNSKVSVDANGKVTCKGIFGAKKANVTAKLVDSAGNVIASDTVVVVFYKLAFQLPSNLPQTFNTVIRKIYFA